MAIQVKICGISTEETLDAAISGGASHIGFNFFAKSPRSVELERATNLFVRASSPEQLAELRLSKDHWPS